METRTIVTINELTHESVSVKTEKILGDESGEYPVGLPHRIAYFNSESSRVSLAAEQPENIVAAIMAMWGDVPTVVENESNEAVTP